MLSVPSLRLNQFGVNVYEALLSGADLQSLVAFEVLSCGAAAQTTRGQAKKTTSGRVNWELLERRISASEHAYQRPIIKKKIDELVAYYLQCADSGTLPAIPGSVLLVSDRRLEFSPSGGRGDSGSLKLPEDSGILRALDGQHRLLALHQLAEKHNLKDFQVPAVVFDNLTADQVVELFVTINSKHTKLNPSHLISLSGRRLYRDENLAAAHDVIRTLNEDDGSPLRGQIKVLGIGRGAVTQASLADALRAVFAAMDAAGGRGCRGLREHYRRRRDPGLACRRAEGRLRRDGRRGRPCLTGVPRKLPAVLSQLLQGGGARVPDGVPRAEILRQELDGAARIHTRRAVRHFHDPEARRKIGRASCRERVKV